MQSIRRVAVLGGNRIPFARSNGPYATPPTRTCSPPRSTGSSPASASQGERLGEVVAGAVLKHARDFNLTRECVLGSRLDPRHPGLRHPAGLRHRPRGGDPGRQQDRARPDRGRHRRRHRHHLRRADRDQRGAAQDAARGSTRAKTLPGAARGRSARLRPRQNRAGDPAERRAAHRAVDGRARRAHRAASGRSPARSRTSSRSPRTSTSPRRTTRGFFDDLVTPFLGLDARPEPAPRLHAWRSSPSSSRSSAGARTPR